MTIQHRLRLAHLHALNAQQGTSYEVHGDGVVKSRAMEAVGDLRAALRELEGLLRQMEEES